MKEKLTLSAAASLVYPQRRSLSVMYQGRDKSVALKDSVLSPEYPKE